MSEWGAATFTVTEDHLKLLRRMYFRYEDGMEFGAPAVDPKRPYGNSDVYGDMAEILGVPIEDEYEGVPAEDRRRFDALHREMTTVLQIVVDQSSVSPGAFIKSGYSARWTAEEEGGR